MAFTSRITLLAALAVAAFQAQAVNVTVAYQTSAEPAKVAQADNMSFTLFIRKQPNVWSNL